MHRRYGVPTVHPAYINRAPAAESRFLPAAGLCLVSRGRCDGTNRALLRAAMAAMAAGRVSNALDGPNHARAGREHELVLARPVCMRDTGPPVSHCSAEFLLCGLRGLGVI